MKKLLWILRIFLFPLIFFTTVLQAEVPTYENVSRLYVATFNRAPDAGGLEYWVNHSNLRLEQIAQSFFDQPETQERYPAGTADHDFIKAVYTNLFNRDPDSGGWSYWEQELLSGRVPKPVFILAVINGAQDTQEYGLDRTILQNKKEVGLYFVQNGLNDVVWAKEVMAEVTAETQSVEDAKAMIDQWREELVRKNSPLILAMYTQVDNRIFENALSPDRLCTLELSGLNSYDITLSVTASKGLAEVSLLTVSTEKQQVTFEAPANIVDGNLTINGNMIQSVFPYRVVSNKTPFIGKLEPEIVRVGEEVELSGANLPDSPLKLVFEGQDLSYSLSVIPVDNHIRFTIPQGVSSGSIYLQIAQSQTNRLYLSVKRMIHVDVSSAQTLISDPSDISFIFGLKEYMLDTNYRTSLDVENEALQYLHAVVIPSESEPVLLYSALVLPNMIETVNIDANSTAVAWVFMGMGASVTVPVDELGTLYDQVKDNSEVQAFAAYINILQHNDFQSWADRSDELLKIKFQEALSSVIESLSMQKSVAAMVKQEMAPNTVVITQTPFNDNIYVNDNRYSFEINTGEKLNNGTVNIINDTRLFMSVEVRNRENGDVVNGYRHLKTALDSNTRSLIGPKGWPILGISSLKNMKLQGIDSHMEIIIGAEGGNTDKSKLSSGLEARVFLEGVAVPALNMVLSTIINKKIDTHFNSEFSIGRRVSDAMGDIYGSAFWVQLGEKIAAGQSSWSTLGKDFILDPLLAGVKECYTHGTTSPKCESTAKGILELVGVRGIEGLGTKLMIMLADAGASSLGKKSLATVPVAGWIMAGAFFVYDNIGYVSDSAMIGESLIDMKSNPKEINVDVDFPLEVSSVTPLCVTQEAGETVQNFQIKGEGFVEVENSGLASYIDIPGNKIDASNISGSSTELTASFNLDELLQQGSREGYLSVANFGYSVFYPELIRLVSAEDPKVYFESVSPKRAMRGDILTIRGCGWVPLNQVKVLFPSKEGSIEGEIVSETIDEIHVRVPKDAISGLVHIQTEIKDKSFYLPIEDFSLSSASVYRLEDGKSFTVDGEGLATIAHLYFVDVNGKRYEGNVGNVTDTGIWVNEAPEALPIGKVQVYVELENGSKSNRVTLVKSPEPPVVVPGDNTWFEQSLTVTMSQENAADIYYRLGNQNGNDVLYTQPVSLVADNMDLLDLYLYVFARVNVNGTTYDSEVEEYGYHTCNEGEVVAHHDDGSSYCTQVDPTVSNDTIYTFDDWKLECPEGMILEHSEEPTEYATTFERDYCVLGNQKHIIKEVLRDSNIIYRENYYLLLEDYFFNNYYWSSVLVYEKEGDETFYYAAKDISGTWDSYYQKKRKWFGNTLEEENLYTLKKNSDGSISWISTVLLEWYSDSTKKAEYYYIAKQDNDGIWWPHIAKEIQWYQSGVKKSESLFSVKQEDNGEWRKVLSKISTWYETGRKNENEEYVSKQNTWGRWQGIQTHYIHWNGDGLLITEEYAEPYKKSDGYWQSVLKEKREWFVERDVKEIETFYEAKQEMGGNYEAGIWVAYPVRVYTQYSAGNREEIHYEYRLNDQDVWEQFLIYMKMWYANSVAESEILYELKQDSDMSWKRIISYETTRYENDIKASDVVYIIRQDLHGKWDGYIESEKRWYDNGNQKKEKIYDMESNSDGTVSACVRSEILWYENGTTKKETSYKTVENNGYWTSLPVTEYTYYSNGLSASKIIYKEIIRDGVIVAMVDSMQCWDVSGHEVSCLE